MPETTMLSRRRLIGGIGALGFAAIAGGLSAACSAATAKPVAMTVHKDPSCGCCTAWAERMTASGRFVPTLVDQASMAELKARLRVPPELAACHTSEVGGYVVEGHVPAADIVRLLRDKPVGIIGLAVPGMPAGSPGMELPGGRRDAYEVIAFTADGRASIFASYAEASSN
jgi:hypothetical protein